MRLSRLLLFFVFSGLLAAVACHHTGPTGDGAPDADTDADSDSDTDVDTDTDSEGDTDTLDECPDPCLAENDDYIPGCGEECGGMADVQCSSDELECAFVTSVLDGMGICLPFDETVCDEDDDCACLAVLEHNLCEGLGDPAWVCEGVWGMCAIECE